MHSRRNEMEQWFIRRGLPHFIEPYGTGPDVWSRAALVLLVAYVAGGLHGLDLRDWSLARNVAAAAVVLALLFATWMLTNRLRHRPALSRPSELGVPELAAFVIGPAIPSAVFGQWNDAVQALVEGLLVLAIVYAITSYGVFPLVGWAAQQTFSRIGSVGRMLTRALPLLLLFTTFLFINAEVWQVAGTLDGPVYLVTLGLFFLMGSAFVLSRVPAAIATVNNFDDWAEVATLVDGTPAAGSALPHHGNPMEIPLSARQRLNIGLVSVFSQAILITFVAAVLALFFMLFGLLAIPEATTASWTQLADVHVLAHWRVGGRTLVLTEPLLRVSGFLGAFSGMYFTVVLGTDATYRDEFAEDAGPQIRQALAVRLAYRHTAGSEPGYPEPGYPEPGYPEPGSTPPAGNE
ncbi:MAG: hypothetical protein Q7V88_08675 [Actinomycetota bacterium]|nr:hypothetical protein [Actinomycetota bacterium]